MAEAKSWDRARSDLGNSRARPLSGARSLKDALSDAGFGDAPPARRREPPPRNVDRDRPEPVARDVSGAVQDPAPALRTLLASLRSTPDTREDVPLIRPVPTSSVVSPPPWLRAKRRGRLQSRMLNTFGWVMTLIVVGSIVGVAGRYLIVPPAGLEHMDTARQ